MASDEAGSQAMRLFSTQPPKPYAVAVVAAA